MKEYSVTFYQKEDGRVPAKAFLQSLDPKMLAKFFRITDLLEEFGPAVRLPYSRHIEGDIFEIRTIQGNDIARVLYFFIEGKTIILTNGFIKKANKTPRREIELAIEYRTDYRRRFGK